ncbi:transcription factor bHLH110 isoform X2 [Ziziphus jujuba]|uniref:Transcription factor bHLH110 isoform X2 n=1 Tax=Ziziphus jujuba TaxID=326968 RepID=A0A6P4A3V6_ZIZJJ|nr:transcription factor bHLH110 isoform X2 [Ziziphus jujuba]
MEYSNHHSQHQLQDQLVNAPTSSLPTLPTCTLLQSTSTANKYSTSSKIILNSTSSGNNDYNQLTEANIPYSRAWSPHDHHHDFISYHNDNTRSFNQLQYSPNLELLLPLSNIKEENSDSFSKLSERISDPLEIVDRLNHLSTSYKQNINIPPPCDMVDNTWLNDSSISSAGCQKFSAGDQVPYFNTTTGTTFGGFTGVAALDLRYDMSDTFPVSTTNYKGLSDSLCSSSSSSLGLNFQGLDLLSSTSYPCRQSASHVNLGLYERSGPLGHDDHQDVQKSKDSPSSNSSSITSAFKNEVSRTKRPSNSGNISEPKASQSATKKSRPSNPPPLKIRKEKLGDRIASLHRLVAPFGKTDTASVLTEAIGYIQFLHDQVQTLSLPYMKSLQSKLSRKMQQGLRKEEEKEKETKLELRSRGLCLVPISCVSYISGYD